MDWDSALEVLGIFAALITAIELSVKGYSYARSNKKTEPRARAKSEKKVHTSTRSSDMPSDLDFAVMYASLAPVDTIAQRMGRMNRYLKKSMST